MQDSSISIIIERGIAYQNNYYPGDDEPIPG
jgi:hypothetical protein